MFSIVGGLVSQLTGCNIPVNIVRNYFADNHRIHRKSSDILISPTLYVVAYLSSGDKALNSGVPAILRMSKNMLSVLVITAPICFINSRPLR